VKTSMTEWEQMYDLIMAGWASQAVRALAALSVAEHLSAGPLTADQLAERESCDATAMYRLLRAATSLDLVRYDDDDQTFNGTPLLAALDGRSPVSLKNYAQAAIGPAFWLPAANLIDAVRQGTPQARDALGTEVFQWLAEHPADGRQFAAAMSDLSEPIIQEAVAHIDTTEADLAVDVGGAEGAFLVSLLRRDVRLRGIVLELEHIIPSVNAEADRQQLNARMQGVAGDFMNAVPEGDVFLLKFILHDWDDASCRTILSTVRRAMRPGARLYIVEMAADGGNVPSALATMDIAMMFANHGQERELGQFAELLGHAGLSMTRVTTLTRPYHLIEAQVR
jgi:O-methyltransferase domain/Dimerisation domain